MNCLDMRYPIEPHVRTNAICPEKLYIRMIFLKFKYNYTMQNYYYFNLMQHEQKFSEKIQTFSNLMLGTNKSDIKLERVIISAKRYIFLVHSYWDQYILFFFCQFEHKMKGFM